MRNYINRIVLLLAAISLLLVSCNKGDPSGGGGVALEVYRGPIYYSDINKFVNLKAIGDWVLDVAYPGDGAQGWASISPTSGSGNASLVLTLVPNESEKSRSCTVDVKIGSKSYPLSLTQLGTDDGDGAPPPVTPPPSGTGPDAPIVSGGKAWAELPATISKPGCAMVAHYTTLKKGVARNYSMLFDLNARVALWVAYPLSADYLGTYGRTKEWSYDPKIPYADQANMKSSYATRDPDNANGNWYDRGHQLPSADRSYDAATNAQTFYASNTTPQYWRLNQGIWATLEGRERGWASSCDTLYVVTGGVLSTPQDATIATTTDRDGKKIAVPKGYFKVLAKYTKSTNSYQTIAFWFDNLVPGGGSYQYAGVKLSSAQATSVAQIEDKSGFTFFGNVPSINKKEFSPSAWGL